MEAKPTAKKGFVRVSKTWYNHLHENVEVLFGMYYDGEEGGTDGEMVIEWQEIGRESNVPQLRIWSDAFHLMPVFVDVFEGLKRYPKTEEGEHMAEWQFVDLLLECGFVDMTPYKRPEE